MILHDLRLDDLDMRRFNLRHLVLGVDPKVADLVEYGLRIHLEIRSDLINLYRT